MTRDEQDKALLVAFAELTFGLSSAGAVKAADAFLAARQPPGEPAINLTCPYCNRSYCNGECEPGMRTPPAPQRFWVVDQTVTGDHWRAYETDADGKVMLGFERLWDTRWQAEADGAASGLPPWKP